jgi:SAM-dependent methyltransferase
MSTLFAVYDTRHYPTMDVSTGYGAWAPTYDQTVDAQLDIALLATLQTVPWPQLRTAVDLACGTGRIGTWLRQQGVTQVHGVDCSPEMLQHAAAKGMYEQLCQADITTCPLPSRAYDLGITVLAVCHLPDLHAFYTEAARLICPGGLCILVDYHPFPLLQGIPTHFVNATGTPVAIANVVHLMSDHVSCGRQYNWSLLEMRERVVDQDWVAHKPRMGRYLHQPISFAMVWQVGMREA